MTDLDSPKVKIEVTKAKPMSVAQTCPVCNSFGTLGYAKKTCHGCNGKGYILIPAEEVRNEPR